MNSRRLVIVTALALATLLSSAAAHADGFVTPFVGVNFGGSTDDKFVDAVNDNSKVNWGIAVGYMGGGIIGFEEELSYTPKFFASGVTFGQVNVVTVMSNLILGIPIGGQSGGGIRPDVVGGVGLLRTDIDRASTLFKASKNDFGYNLGGGIMGYFADHIGIRGDVRYFRNINASDEADNPVGIALSKGNLNFIRGSIGLVLRF
jgi:Outer membrane protein beta-barrel domain